MSKSGKNSNVWVVPDIELMDTGEPTPSSNTFDFQVLDEIDTSGTPVKEMHVVGARISSSVKAKREALAKKWFEDGGSMEGYLELVREDKDAQWERIFSANGVCPTITITEQPVILCCNEVSTNTIPVEMETATG